MLPSRIYLAAATALAIAHHASEERPITTAALEGLYHLPPRKLEPIVRKLTRAGVLHSIRGAKGGYYLPHPDTVSLERITHAVLDGKAEALPLPPLGELLTPAFERGVAALLKELGGCTIGALLRQAAEKKLFSLKAQSIEYVI